MPRREWFDVPATTSPLSASMLNDLEARKVEVDESWVNLRQFGWLGTGDSIDVPMTSAVAALGANGGTIYIPAGLGTFSSLPSFAQTRSIVLQGAGGVSAGAQAATLLRYTGTGTRAIDARSSYGFKLRDLQIVYNNASFTGTLIDFSQSVAVDAAFMAIDNCFLGGSSGVRGAAKILDLDKAISGTFHDSVFQQARVAVSGRVNDSNYSNSHSFTGCMFKDQTFQHITSAGEAWSFIGCTFEPLITSGGVLAGAGAFTLEGPTSANALTFRDCWFGDATASGDWINFKGEGFTFESNHCGGGLVGLRFDQNDTVGVLIKGNRFRVMTYGMSIGGTGNVAFDIFGNKFNTVTNRISLGSIPKASIIQGIDSEDSMHVFGLRVSTSTVSDGGFPAAPPDGTVMIEDVASVRKWCVRIGGTWYKTTLT